MNIDERLETIFRTVFRVPETRDVRSIRQVAEPEWDSLAHATLIAAIESEFELSIDIADALDMTSFDAARLIVGEALG